jgi:SHAQKYF class myb-like DNA-binding protein
MKSFESSKHPNRGRWTREEMKAFIHGLNLFGRDWVSISKLVGSRSSTQVRSHAQKFFIRAGETANSEKADESSPSALSINVDIVRQSRQRGKKSLPKPAKSLPVDKETQFEGVERTKAVRDAQTQSDFVPLMYSYTVVSCYQNF